MNKPECFCKMTSLEGYVLEPYFDEKGLHFPVAAANRTLYDQYIPKKILYQLIDEYFKSKKEKR